jgi:hypothetical protein
MIKSKHILALTFVTSIVFGCGELAPNVAFDEPIKGRTIDLSNNVGESFQIIRENDTVSYSLYFNKNTDFNYLVKSETDTVFIGTVTKRNELFLLNRQLENGKFAIHALKFTDTTVTGLETEWRQSNIINNEIDSGKYVNLITDTTGINTIKAEKKDGKEIFRFVIEQLEAERLIVDEAEFLKGNYEENSPNTTLDIQPISKPGLIKNVYPNPFIDNVTIKLIEDAQDVPYIFKVFSISGKHIKTLKLQKENINIKLPNLKSGYYILKILGSDTELLDEVKLIKK